MEEGVYIFNDAEDFLQFMKELQEVYNSNAEKGVERNE